MSEQNNNLSPSNLIQEEVVVASVDDAPQQVDNMQNTITSLLPMLLIFGVFYFLLIRPQEKKRKAQEQLVSTSKIGEEVLLHSGIYGKIVKINENDATIILQIAKDTEMKVMQSAIADIVSRKNPNKEKAESQDSKNDKEKKGKK